MFQVIFAAFAPTSLNHMLANLEELPKASPSFRGLDVINNVSLVAALVLIATLMPVSFQPRIHPQLSVVLLATQRWGLACTLPRVPARARIGARTRARVCVWGVALMLVPRQVLIMPQVETLYEAKDALCGGNLDFVYAVARNGVLNWGVTDPNQNRPQFRPWRRPPADDSALMPTERIIDELLHRPPGFTCNKTSCFITRPSDKPRWGQDPCCYAEEFRAPTVINGGVSMVRCDLCMWM